MDNNCSICFFTNRVWVFNAPTESVIEFIKQTISFLGGRVITLVIEEVILLLFITILRFPSMPVKGVAQVVVIVLNYVISKALVLRKIDSMYARENSGEYSISLMIKICITQIRLR